MSDKLKLEVWRSTMNHIERHYFRINSNRGYQQNEYVFGFNPEVIEVREVTEGLWELSLKDGNSETKKSRKKAH